MIAFPSILSIMPSEILKLSMALALLSGTLVPPSALSLTPVPSSFSKKTELAAANTDNEPAAPGSQAKQISLAQAVSDYKADCNEISWAVVVSALEAMFSQAENEKLPPASIIQSHPELSELGVKFVDAPFARVWFFPQITDSHGLFVQWHELKAQVPPLARRRRGHYHALPPVTVYRFQYVPVPSANYVKEARIIDTGAGRLLVVAGKSHQSMYLGAYKFIAGQVKETAEPLSLIPPYLLNNLTGNIGFSGQDVVLTINPSATATNPECRLSLRMVDGRYALEGKAAPDTPYNAVQQFLQAAQQGRLDLAKAWLADPSLVSILRYTGLSTHNLNSASRIINMSGPPPGIYRYRLVTFDRDDLILDVGKTKTQWAIKAAFVAPSDPVWQKIARTLPAAAPEAKADLKDEKNGDKASPGDEDGDYRR